MAKSCLDLRGGKGRNLELDFSHLATAIRDIESKGDKVRAFLLVLDEKVWRRANGWRTKYALGDEVEVVLAKLSADERANVLEEKSRNQRGNKKGGNATDAVAKVSQGIAEAHLATEIQIRFPAIRKCAPEMVSLRTVAWDFYGQADTTEDANAETPLP